MKKLTYKELLTKLEENCGDVSNFAHYGVRVNVPEDFEPLPEGSEGDYDQIRDRQDKYTATLGYGEVKQVDSHGGEGEGEDWWVVYHFVDHGVYINVSGFYQSYNGTDFWDGWGSCSEVSPKQRTITVYE